MEFTTEQSNPCTLEFTINVDAEQVSRTFESVYREFSRYVSVPGFRPGKAPRTLMEKYVNQGRLQERVREKLVAEIRSVALGHVFGQKTGRTLTGSSVPILSRSDKVWDRGRPGRPPECNEHGHDTNHTHGCTVHQLPSPGQRASTDASHRQKHVPMNRTSLERFN